jgi:hypothetical protein
MKETINLADADWIPSVYFAESLVNTTLDYAWTVMLDYQAWNPTFADAQVTLVKGQPSTEGELVLISKKYLDAKGEPLPAFYCETVKIVPHRRIVWYAYPKLDNANQMDSFRNFVDFGLTAVPGGVRFDIYYYAQNRVLEGQLATERKYMESFLSDLAVTFKKHCETPG